MNTQELPLIIDEQRLSEVFRVPKAPQEIIVDTQTALEGLSKWTWRYVQHVYATGGRNGGRWHMDSTDGVYWRHGPFPGPAVRFHAHTLARRDKRSGVILETSFERPSGLTGTRSIHENFNLLLEAGGTISGGTFLRIDPQETMRKPVRFESLEEMHAFELDGLVMSALGRFRELALDSNSGMRIEGLPNQKAVVAPPELHVIP
jgi:hypothetical protein